MSSYTMQLREFIEQASQYTSSLSIKDKIETGRTKLFDFDYPIFDENYKKDFETHFIRFFYMREIGFETEGLFKFHLETWLLINMPYFNNLFKSELLTYDPLTNTKNDSTNDRTNDKTQDDKRDTTGNTTISETNHSESNQTDHITGSGHSTNDQTNTTDGTNDKTGTSDLTEDNFNRDIESDTPDGPLALTANDGEGTIEYASKIKEENENNHKTGSTTENDVIHSESTGNSTQDTTSLTDGTSNNTTDGNGNKTADETKNDTLNRTENENENITIHNEGKIGVVSYAKLLQEHRETFLRIEKEIFKEMQELFMLVY